MGTISASGLYSIPRSFAGSVTITATSIKDSTVTASATVVVGLPPNPIGVLTAAPDSASVGHSITVQFTIRWLADGMRRLVLQSLDAQGKVMSEVGEMRDDGLNGDTAAGDGLYSIQIAVPAGKAGSYEFRVSGQYKDRTASFQPSGTLSFPIVRNDTINAKRDLWASTFDDTLTLFWNSEPGVARDVLSRSPTPTGPWKVLQDMHHNVTTGEEPGIKFVVDDGTKVPDAFYKIDEYNKSNKIVKSFDPLSVPAYSDEDAVLILEPPRSRPPRSRSKISN